MYNQNYFNKLLMHNNIDIITSYFKSKGKLIKTKFNVRSIDLGCSLIRIKAIQKFKLSFNSSTIIPKFFVNKFHNHLSLREKNIAYSRIYHDNDWWYIYNAIYKFNMTNIIIQVLQSS